MVKTPFALNNTERTRSSELKMQKSYRLIKLFDCFDFNRLNICPSFVRSCPQLSQILYKADGSSNESRFNQMYMCAVLYCVWFDLAWPGHLIAQHPLQEINEFSRCCCYSIYRIRLTIILLCQHPFNLLHHKND